MTRTAVPATWRKLATPMIRDTPTPIQAASEILIPNLAVFRTHRHLFCEWNPKLLKAERRLEHWGIRSEFAGHEAAGFTQHECLYVKRHEKGDTFLLLATVSTMGDLMAFGEEADRLSPRFDIALMKTLNVDSATTTLSEFRNCHFAVDSSTCGRVVASKWTVLCHGELTSSMFNLSAKSHGEQTLGYAYQQAGLEADADNAGSKRIIPLDGLRGLVVTHSLGDVANYSN